MSFTHPRIDIQFAPEFSKDCIYFTFREKFTLDASEQATRYWSNLLDKSESKSFSFIWDCTEMTGFEPSARKTWYGSMKKYKSRISHITIISPSILIRGAARVMMEMFGMKSKMLKSKEELNELV